VGARNAGISVLVLILAAGSSSPAPAATPQEIDAAIQKGCGYLKKRFGKAPPAENGHGIGLSALVGLALLESGTAADDPAVRFITTAVRDGSYTEIRTYQLSLCLLYLDRLGDPADEPLIQLLAVRLLAGQNLRGGWTYDCIEQVPKEVERRLRAALPTDNQLVRDPDPKAPRGNPPGGPPVAGRLNAEVQKYASTLPNGRRGDRGDDNSNTQFAVLAVWVARRHGLPTDAALELIEHRFLTTQNPQTGGWAYNAFGADGSPAMTCAGLLGLATAVARREERLLKAEAAKSAPAKPEPPKPDPKFDDPFFVPAPPPKENPAPKRQPVQPDARDVAVERGLRNLAKAIAPDEPRNGKNKNPVRLLDSRANRDFYFLWSLERVAVVYGLEKIGGIDWYAVGADNLVEVQHDDGSWGGDYGPGVDTAFALLFLSRSNVVRDLSRTVQRNTVENQMRVATPNPSADPRNNPRTAAEPTTTPGPMTAGPILPLVPPPSPQAPAPVGSASLVDELVRSSPDDWPQVLARMRDTKGPEHTAALVLAIPKLEGDRKKQAREALSERLTRMSPETLREMMKSDDPELRRAAVLAAAMKDDRSHVPDLIDRIKKDDDESVVRAARAGLKSLSGGQDFGPAPEATKADREAAAKAWRDWWAKQK
jgi:hypothetical protein